VIVLSLIVHAIDPTGTSGDKSGTTGQAKPSATAPTTTGTVASQSVSPSPASHSASASPASKPSLAASRPTARVRAAFPPRALAGFKALADTGDAGAVRQVAFSSEGLPACPSPTYSVAVSQKLTGRALQADLAAFFENKDLTSSQCQAFVYAYHSRADYLENQNNGYTAGRVALTNDSGSQNNLELDTGSVYDVQSQFDFNY
jgi:hypothetical protein